MAPPSSADKLLKVQLFTVRLIQLSQTRPMPILLELAASLNVELLSYKIEFLTVM